MLREEKEVRYLGHEVRSGRAEGFQHRSGLCVKQRHSVGHFIVDFVFDVQLQEEENRARTEVQIICTVISLHCF